MRFCILLAITFYSLFSLSFEPPRFTPNVVDQTGELSAADITELNKMIDTLHAKGIFAAVYMLETLGPISIEEAAVKTFEKWQLGEKGQDNGVLFMFALDDRNARIEVGYGLEGDITDLDAKYLLDQVILPEFKKSNFAQGIANGLLALQSKEYQELSGRKSVGDFEISVEAFVVWILIVWSIFIMSLFRSHKIGGLKSNKFGLFLACFLSINPGIFILMLYAPIRDVATNYGNWYQDITTILILFVALLLYRSIFRMLGYIQGRKNRNFKNPNVKSFKQLVERNYSVLWIALGILFTSFYYYLTGVIRILDQAAFSMDIITLITHAVDSPMVLGVYLLSLAGYTKFAYDEYKTLASEKSYIRAEALKRLHRIHRRVEGTRTIFGKTHTYHRPSNRSGGSFSSSSRGGRSGGGGSSSRW